MNIIFRTCAYAFTPSIEMRSSIKCMSNFPPLAQACSLCPIQNSKFSSRPTCPPRWRKLAACAQFKIQNSKFIIPLALFKALYRLKKLFSRHYPCLSSVLKRLPVLSLLRHCWLRSPKVAC